MGADLSERPGDIVPAVGGKAQAACGLEDAVELVKHVEGDDAPLVVAPLGPGIGEQQEDTADAGLAEVGNEFAGIAVVNPDVVEALLLDGAKQLGDAVDISLAADKAD
jgi:hypothetical protein